MPRAESFDAIRARVLPAWERVVTAHRGGRVVLVAHGVVSKVLLFSLLPGLTVADWTAVGKVLNLAVSTLVQPAGGAWRAESLLVVPDPVRALAGGPGGSAA
jgi:probable phosphoglycerate mutase